METDLTKIMLVIFTWFAVLYTSYATYMYCGVTPKDNPTVKGKIIKSSMTDATVGRGVDIDISYEYYVDNERFVSNRICCGSSGYEEAVYKYPVGKQVTVFYRENKPNLSVIEPEIGRFTKIILYCWVVLLVVSHVLLFGGLGLVANLVPIMIGAFIISLALWGIIDPPTNPSAALQSFWSKLLMLGIASYVGLVLFLTPFFIKKKHVAADYHNSNDIGKAKTNLFYFKLFSPLFLLLIGGYIKYVGLDLKISLFLVLLLSHLVWSINKIKKEK